MGFSITGNIDCLTSNNLTSILIDQHHLTGTPGKMTFDKNLDVHFDNQAAYYISANGSLVFSCAIQSEQVTLVNPPVWSNGQRGFIADGIQQQMVVFF